MFHALVSVKQVPDTTNIRIDPETGNLIREGVPAIFNPYDAHALAAAVEWKRKLGGKVTVITMGPASCTATLRESIELGADEGILISAREFSGADTLATSYVLAETIKAINEKDPIDMYFFGKQAIDGDTAQVGPGVGVRLNVPVITYAINIREININEKYAIVERKTERWVEVIKAKLPLLITCENTISKIPFAPLPDLVRSLTYEPETWGFDSPKQFNRELVGTRGSPTIVYRSGTPPQPEPGEVVLTKEAGLDQAIKTALDKAEQSGVLNSILGGV